MIVLITSCLAVLLNLFLYFIFGSLITGALNGRRLSATVSVIIGFFLYYILFDITCIPVMLLYRPLSLLSKIWAGEVVLITAIAAILNRNKWVVLAKEIWAFIVKHRGFVIFALLLTVIEAVLIIRCYQFTYDAAYYVGTASTSLFTDSIKIYDPYTGMWQDHFEMRYFLSNYAVNDAVFCYLLNIRPLVWTKTIMEGTVIVLVNLVCYRLGSALFKGDIKKTGVFLFFSVFTCFFYSTIYTSQEFLITRTYEGKTVLGAFVLPLILLVYIKLLQDHKDSLLWITLLLIALGSLVLSNSAGMLIPGALAIYMVPLSLIKKDPKVLLKTGLICLPCLSAVVMYVLYVKGYFVVYTMPR